jgi:hypothetical protein
MEKKEEVIAVIMKLMELSNVEKNSNPHEREAAAQKAAQLMAKWCINIADLRSSKPKEDVFVTMDVEGSSEVKVDYEASLANAIATAFDCKMINTYYKGPWAIAFCGTKHDLEIAVFFFKYLRRTIFAMARLNFPKSLNSRRNYCYGMVGTIGKRLQELYQKREEFIPSDCRALVVVKKEGLQRYFKEQFPNAVQGRRTSLRGNLDAYYKGQEHGRHVLLHRPVSQGVNKAQIG